MNFPLIVTLKLDKTSADYLNELRQKYFPADKNYLQAHLTLFHALPYFCKEPVEKELAFICATQLPLKLILADLYLLGRGVAVEVESMQLKAIKKILQSKRQTILTAQDKQNNRMHITLQNKVLPQEAKITYQSLLTQWRPFQAQGLGFSLWQYRGGPWKFEKDFLFNS